MILKDINPNYQYNTLKRNVSETEGIHDPKFCIYFYSRPNYILHVIIIIYYYIIVILIYF